MKNKNQMSLIPRPQRAGKAIKRIKIMSRILTNPEESRSAQKSYPNKVDQAKSLEDDEKKTSPSGLTSYTKHNHFFTHNPYSTVKPNYNETKFRLEDSPKSKVKQTSIIKYQQIIQQPRQQSITYPNLLGKKQRETRQRSEVKQVVHMNYKEYEKLMEKQEVFPAYFENIAKKNDESMAYRDQILQKQHKSVQNIERGQGSSNSKSQKKYDLPILSKKNRSKTVRSENSGNDSMKTILGCNLGALSNIQIKQKLEQKWINEQKQIIKNTTLVFTQQSEIISEVDTKQQTNRQQMFMMRDQKKKNKKNSKQKQEINWNMIPNEKFKQTLRRILQINKNESYLKNAEKQFSVGDEYYQKQQNLLASFKVYRPKEFIMKHKLQWKR